MQHEDIARFALLILAGLVLEHHLFDIMYPVSRTALWLIPGIMLYIYFLADHAISRYRVHMRIIIPATLLIMAPLLLSFFTGINLSHTRTWKYDAHTKEAMEIYRQIHVHGEKQIEKIIQQMRDSEHNYDDVNFTPPYLGTIKARTLIVGGDRDKYYPVEIFIEMYRSIPDSELLIFPNTGHAVVGTNYVEEVKKIALDFLLKEGEPA